MFGRDATAEDSPWLVRPPLKAVNWDGRPRFIQEQVVAEPAIAHYVTAWPRPRDFGLVAYEDDPGGEAVIGAAWCRQFTAVDPGYGYLADDVPEFAIGVAPADRGRGLGGAQLAADQRGTDAGLSSAQLERRGRQPGPNLLRASGLRGRWAQRRLRHHATRAAPLTCSRPLDNGNPINPCFSLRTLAGTPLGRLPRRRRPWCSVLAGPLMYLSR